MPKIVKGGDRGRGVVVRLGEVLSSRRRQLGDMALNAGGRDVDQDRQEQAAGLGGLEQRPPSPDPQAERVGAPTSGRPDRGAPAGRGEENPGVVLWGGDTPGGGAKNRRRSPPRPPA